MNAAIRKLFMPFRTEHMLVPWSQSLISSKKNVREYMRNHVLALLSCNYQYHSIGKRGNLHTINNDDTQIIICIYAELKRQSESKKQHKDKY